MTENWASDWAASMITPEQASSLVKAMHKAEHAHHGGFNIFGWAFNFGIRKINPKYPPKSRVWWN